MSRPKLVSTLVLCVGALALAGGATAAKPTPAKADKHDRALIKKLLGFESSSADTLPTAEELGALAGSCTVWDQADEEQTLELTAALLVPAIVVAIDRQEPDIDRYGRRLAPMRPHARVFKDWLAMKRRETANALLFVQRFDSARMDVCAYLDAVLAAGDDQAALEAAFEKLITNPDDIGALMAFADVEELEEPARKTANARFALFLRRSGYSKAQVAELTG